MGAETRISLLAPSTVNQGQNFKVSGKLERNWPLVGWIPIPFATIEIWYEPFPGGHTPLDYVQVGSYGEYEREVKIDIVGTFNLHASFAGTVVDNPCDTVVKITVIGPAKVKVTIVAHEGGTTDPAPGTYMYSSDQRLYIHAISHTGYVFDHWTINGSPAGTGPTLVYTVGLGAVTIEAFFRKKTPEMYVLTINASPGGTTEPKPGSYEYSYGSQVTIRAIPNGPDGWSPGGYRFVHWRFDTGGTKTQNPITISIYRDISIIAVFEPIPTYGLLIVVDGYGTTDPKPGVYSYTQPTEVRITGIPDSGHFLNYWLVNGETKHGNPITVSVKELGKKVTVRAVFGRVVSITLTIRVEGAGTTDPPPGTYTHKAGDEVTIRAIPSLGYAVAGWTVDGEQRPPSDTITLTLTTNTTVTASFKSMLPPLPPATELLPWALVGVAGLAGLAVLGYLIKAIRGK